MDKKLNAFGDTEIGKHIFHYRKNLISIDDVDIDKILISSKISFCKKSFKYLIGQCKTSAIIYSASK